MSKKYLINFKNNIKKDLRFTKTDVSYAHSIGISAAAKADNRDVAA